MRGACAYSSGGPGHDSERALARADALRTDRQAVLVRQRAEAEIAEQPARVELVQTFAGERRAQARRAARAAAAQSMKAPPEKHGAEVGHGCKFRAQTGQSSARRTMKRPARVSVLRHRRRIP